MTLNRRRFLARIPPIVGSTLGASALLATGSRTLAAEQAPAFRISLAQWSLHRTFFGDSFGPDFRRQFLADPDAILRGQHHPLDFPVLARNEFGVDAVEYVNTFFYAHAKDAAYLAELKKRADGEGVRSLLIMCDALGNMGDADSVARARTVENHRPWLDAAAFLGCHAIRVNAAGQGEPAEVSRRVAGSLNQLANHAESAQLSVLVENHGGVSSDGGWLAGTIDLADHPRVGTLPDFGNFRISGRGADAVHYDRYQGVRELMPRAGAVSAKSYDFDEAGFETTIDYERMLRIVLESGYRGFVGIEYEGQRLSEFDGIKATKRLLEKLQSMTV
jgi:sugar phosphate isomerase/epimerase